LYVTRPVLRREQLVARVAAAGQERSFKRDASPPVSCAVVDVVGFQVNSSP
jgi:hypothetical protein